MVRKGTTVRRVQLARRLRALREKAGLTLEAAAPLLDWSPSKLSRIENAHQRVDVHSVRGMLDLYDVGGEQWTELVALTRAASQRGWWRAYGLNDHGYVPLEAEASMVRIFTLAYMPGLLQTAEYARAMFRAGQPHRSEAGLENDVVVRMIRQERLTSDEQPLQLVAIVDESALHRPVGGPDVMCAQLVRLVDAAALDSVTLQVLPISVGAHPSLASGFALLSFDTLAVPDMAYVEHSRGAVHLEKEDDVAPASLVFDHLRSEALSPGDSVALIERVAAQT